MSHTQSRETGAYILLMNSGVGGGGYNDASDSEVANIPTKGFFIISICDT